MIRRIIRVIFARRGTPVLGPRDGFLLLEDGSFILLENGTDRLRLEPSPP
jgi:hypothetical protein